MVNQRAARIDTRPSSSGFLLPFAEADLAILPTVDYLIMHNLIMHTLPKNLILHEQLVESNRSLQAKIRAHNA